MTTETLSPERAATDPAADSLVATAGQERTRTASFWSKARRRPVYAAAAVILVAIVALGMFGPFAKGVVADPQQQSLLDRLQPPLSRGQDGTFHLLGTDQLGRDVFSRLLSGGRVSLTIAGLTMVISGVFGTTLGVIAGYRLGVVDQGVMRLVDLQQAFPSLLLSIFLLYLLGPSLVNLVLLLAIFSWAGYARVARAQTLSLRNQTFVEGAVALGCSDLRVLARHILPHLLPALVVISVFEFAGVILGEAGLSFLGLGVQPPDSSWGLMLAQGQEYITSGAWWLIAAPATMIFLLTLSANLSSRWAQELLGTAPGQGR